MMQLLTAKKICPNILCKCTNLHIALNLNKPCAETRKKKYKKGKETDYM